MLIVGNWKAYIEKKEQAKSLYEAAKKLSVSGKHQIVIAPPLPYIGILIPTARGKVGFAAQDISNTTGGAETGETTAAMLAAIGVTHTIVGHSVTRSLTG
jgi:triosephosphate isomerase